MTAPRLLCQRLIGTMNVEGNHTWTALRPISLIYLETSLSFGRKRNDLLP